MCSFLIGKCPKIKNPKKEALIDVLAQKYAENVTGIDARIEELKAQNSGLISKALNALSGVFAFIVEIKNTLTSLLAGIIEAVQAIIADPIGFFTNLIAGVSQGFTNFGNNILKHLKTGLITWLTGAMDGMSLKMPEDVFSLQGIFSIASQILGFTWDKVRKIGVKVVGEPAMHALEAGFELVMVFRRKNKSEFRNLDTDIIIKKSEEYAKTILTRNHAILHNPNQVAGGEAFLGDLYKKGEITDETSLKASKLIGHLGTNSSIGSQWSKQGRIGELHTHVKEQYKGLSEDQKENVKMNVNLKY